MYRINVEPRKSLRNRLNSTNMFFEIIKTCSLLRVFYNLHLPFPVMYTSSTFPHLLNSSSSKSFGQRELTPYTNSLVILVLDFFLFHLHLFNISVTMKNIWSDYSLFIWSRIQFFNLFAPYHTSHLKNLWKIHRLSALKTMFR